MSDAFLQISKQYIKYGVTNEWYSCNKTFFFRTFLAFSIIPIPLEILFLIYELWCVHFSLSSSITPKNLVKVT